MNIKRTIPAFLALGLLLAGCSSGVNYPLLMGMSIQFVAETERATAMGLHQAVYAIGMFAGPWLSGMLADSLKAIMLSTRSLRR